jgi:hypothetical protein
MEEPQTPNEHWYALYIQHRKLAVVEEILTKRNIDYYKATKCITNKNEAEPKRKPIFPSLLFTHTSEANINALEQEFGYLLRAYREAEVEGSRKLAVIPDIQMERFITMTSLDNIGLEFHDAIEVSKCPKVLITQGALKGFVGHMKRIHGNRRFVFVLPQVCALSTNYIPASHREFIEKNSTHVDLAPNGTKLLKEELTAVES